MNHMKKGFDAKILAEAGLAIALSKILDFFVLFKMPLGGSVTLGSMAPLFIFAIRWGVRRGLFVGAAAGLVQMLIGGTIVHPLQGMLDYPIAYAMCGLAGFAAGKDRGAFISYMPGMIVASAMRLIAHTISGMVFFAEVDFTKPGASLLQALSPENWGGALSFSFQYNATFLGPDLLICLVIVGLLWRPLRGYVRKQF